MAYFLDSSAIIEFIDGKETRNNISNQKIITNSLHLGEVYYYFLREHNKLTADFWLKKLDVDLIEPTKEITSEASLFKYENKKVPFSYVDCIGYVSALKTGLIFLTKDKDFLKFDSVEFVDEI